MQTFATNFRNCATCGRWGGSRQTNSLGSSVQTQFNARGLCMGGEFNQQQMPAGQSCQQYVKWQALR